MRIRSFQPEDLQFAKTLVDHEKWGTDITELQDLFDIYGKGAFLGIINEEPIGMVFATAYRKKGFIGDLIIKSDHRGQGYGQILFKKAIQYLEDQGISSILLDAIPDVARFYRKFQFHEICKSWRISGMIQSKTFPNIFPMHNFDWEDICFLDELVFGSDRSHLLEFQHHRYPELCWVLKRGNQVRGFIMGIQKSDHIKIGPWVVHPLEEHALTLLYNINPKVQVNPIKFGVLDQNKGAIQEFKDIGLEFDRYSIRMNRGKIFANSSGEYAIGGPDRG